MAKLNTENVRFLNLAFSQAAIWHADDLRKGTDIPYLTHLMDVSSLVLQHGGSIEQAAAALLHDSLEDAKDKGDALKRQDWILNYLGQEALSIVQGCTDGLPNADGVKPPWQERKMAYLKHLEEADPKTWLVSCCDKLHNARSIVADLEEIGDQLWTRFSASKEQSLWYYDQLSNFFTARDVRPSRLLSKAVEQMKELSK